MGKRRSLKLVLLPKWVDQPDIVADVMSHKRLTPDGEKAYQRIQTYLRLGKSLLKQTAIVERQIIRAWRAHVNARKYNRSEVCKALTMSDYAYMGNVRQMLRTIRKFYTEVPA
jgi:hypothetical protein